MRIYSPEYVIILTVSLISCGHCSCKVFRVNMYKIYILCEQYNGAVLLLLTSYLWMHEHTWALTEVDKWQVMLVRLSSRRQLPQRKEKLLWRWMACFQQDMDCQVLPSLRHCNCTSKQEYLQNVIHPEIISDTHTKKRKLGALADESCAAQPIISLRGKSENFQIPGELAAVDERDNHWEWLVHRGKCMVWKVRTEMGQAGGVTAGGCQKSDNPKC